MERINDMLSQLGNVALFTARQVVYWLTAIAIVIGGYFGAMQVSYQPVMTTGDWLFVMITVCGVFINIGMYLSQFARQKEINSQLARMRDEWLEYKGEMRGEARGRKEQWLETKVWFEERERSKLNES